VSSEDPCGLRLAMAMMKSYRNGNKQDVEKTAEAVKKP
jgi:hypothetical protein